MTIGAVRAHPEWRLIVEALSTREYGSVVTHAELTSLTGLSYPSPRYFGQVSKARVALLDDWQREIEPYHGVGYRLVNPADFFGRGRREVVRAGRRLRMSMRVHQAAPQHLLSDADNARNANALAKVGSLESQRRRVLIETRPSLPVPKIDTPKLLRS
jgi:hypothetical protein